MARGAVVHLIALASLIPIRAASGADCNSNGTPDVEEIRAGALPDCNANGVPDGCDILPVNYGLVSNGSFFVAPQSFDFVIDDLDADGDGDIVGGSGVAEGLAILWNDGKGRFASPERWLTGQVTRGIVPGTLDGDALEDLAIGGSIGLSVLFQTSEGRFVQRMPVVATRIQAIAGADIDGDSDLDIAAAVSFGVRILRNDGTGAFAPLDTMPLGSDPVTVLAADLDGDGDIDLATSNGMDIPFPTGNVSILINKGDGSFDTARNYVTGSGPMAMISEDLDGDGDLDMATASREGRTVTLLAGDGRGRFTGWTQLVTGRRLQALSSSDLDRDGDLDLAVAGLDVTTQGGVSVLLNHGRAEFSRPVEFDTGFAPLTIRHGDIDGNGSVDLLASDFGSGAVTVLQGSPVAYATDCNANLLPDDCELEGNDCNANELPDACDIASRESPDCDVDGTPDECQPDCNGNEVADACDIASGLAADCNRNGSPDDCDVREGELVFEAAFLPSLSLLRLLGSSDLDADGRDDIHGIGEQGELLLFWNGGPAGFRGDVLSPAHIRVTDIATGDLNGDGSLEIVLAETEIPGLRRFDNRGERTFEPGAPIPFRGAASLVSLADLDGDRDLDIAATSLGGSVMILENRGEGTLGNAILVGGGRSLRILEVGDLDGDGLPELVTDSGAFQSSLLIFWNEGSLEFDASTVLDPQFPIDAAGIADADGDGDKDIVLSTDRLVLFRNAGGRSFMSDQDARSIPLRDVGGMVPGDLDLDGDQDLAIVFESRISALLNQGGGVFDLPVGLAPTVGTFTPPAAGDWNGDGGMDLAVFQNFFCPDCPILAPPAQIGDGPQMVLLTNTSRPRVSRDTDRNGVPDECQQRPFHRGDANGDGQVDLTDPVFTLRHLFGGERVPACLEAADTNNDARLEITDPIGTLEFLFRGGPPPAQPGPAPAPCGLDTDASGSPGDIGCGAYESCGV